MTDINSLGARFLTLKRALFDKYYDHLNDMQRKAVYTANGPLLILAGAGSGKTTVLVNRIAYIIRYGDAVESSLVPSDINEDTIIEMENAMSLPKEDLAEYLVRFAVSPPPAWSVLAITFTNKAASEIKARLRATFGEDSTEASEIWAGTFHSVCMRLLRRWGTEVGYQSGFGVCDTDDAKKLISACMKQLNIDEKQLPVKSVMNLISRAKDRLLTPEGFALEAGSDFKLKQAAKIYALYQERLVSSNLLDFDDIIMQTVRLLTDCREARDSIQNKFRYVSVDEYQDTNKAQLALTLLLSGKHNNIMVVGDDDQSIYKFRGATIENILNFEATCKGAKVVKLEQNYRSTKTILDAANGVIARNTTRHNKKLWTDSTDGEKITVRNLGNQNDEARFICDEVHRSVAKKEASYRDYAVLYRTNAQSRSLEQAFAKSGIPYRMLGGTRFYDRLEIRDILAYLCLINNPLDDLRLKRIINVPKRGIGDKSILTAEAMAIASGYPMLEFIRHAQDYKAIPVAAAKSMEEFAQLIEDLRIEAAESSVSDLIRNVVEITGYGRMLAAAGEEEADRLDNIGELISSAAQYEQSTQTPSLSEFLEDVALVSDVDKYDETADAVVLMTIHSAKGLEFPIVFLPGMEEGLFPGHQSIINPDEIEEERRLAYVAITRAKKKLFITHVHDRMLNGSTQFNQVSRFVGEIPEELIENVGRQAYSADKRISFGASGSGYSKPMNSFGSYGKPSFSGQSRGGVTRPSAKSVPTTPLFAVGDRVKHTTFGKGSILSVRAMGADTLYEIAFDNVGTKKLMATYAKLVKSDD
ncbi:MAG: UvrD-helicase domain-containing protein [Clostridia bacterium]|nr:UvrD-helicase domain-containing protein [Clostridia bacterium]